MLISRDCWKLFSLGALLLAGCSKSEKIEHYTVAKPVATEVAKSEEPAAAEQPAGEPTDRTLGGIVAAGEQGWFFKLTGPKDPVAAQVDAFTTFLKSIRFSAEGKPQWTLPEGWTEQPGSGIRYATLLVGGGEKPLEVTVTALPKTPGDENAYLLSNINRWRGQMKLPPIVESQLADETTRVPLEGTTATMVNLLGTAAPNTMGRAPFFPGAGNGN